MFDVIFENTINTLGVLLFFSFTFGIKEFIVDEMTQRDRFSDVIPDYIDTDFERKFKDLLLKGLFICVAAAFVISYALGRSSCDEIDYTTQTCITEGEISEYKPTEIQRAGIFTSVFIYTYSIVVMSAIESKNKHTNHIRKVKENLLKK